METPRTDAIRRAEIVLGTRDLDRDLDFFKDALGFRIETIFPADRPRVAVLAGHGTRLRLEVGEAEAGGHLRLEGAFAEERGLTAPNGVRVELVPERPALAVPPLACTTVVTRAEDTPWNTGRAGMRYRDLLPRRAGGHLIASHISILDGGPVPDYVHFHRVRFQLIFCVRGWVRVAYEGQGAPLVMHAGDAVLQPPGIRHRVLECSEGLEVVELTVPAEHPTFADHDLELPDAGGPADRLFGGQPFVLHRAADAAWHVLLPGLESADLGIAAATGDRADARVLRGVGPGREWRNEDAPLALAFVLAGGATLEPDPAGPAEPLGPGDAACLPPTATAPASLRVDPGCELLLVQLHDADEEPVGRPAELA